MARFYLPPTSWQQHAVLDEEESRHCAQVLRLDRGDKITLFDGRGRSATAVIEQVRKNAVAVTIESAQEHPARRPEITLVQAIPKGKTMEWIVEKAVELGVQRIVPLITRHTIVKYDAADAPKKAEKWQRVAIEACKQCGQNWLPQVAVPQEWQQWQQGEHPGLKIIASLAPGATSFRDLLEKYPNVAQASILIGPEGDFSPQETQQALELGYQPITLGDIILRTETASLYCLAALRYQYQ